MNTRYYQVAKVINRVQPEFIVRTGIFDKTGKEIDKDVIREIFYSNCYGVGENEIKDEIIVDLGAHIGVFSVYAALCGAKIVYAYEPLKSNYDLLVKNIAVNNLQNKIIPIQKAITGQKGKAKIVANSRDSYIYENGDEEVNTITLYDIFVENKIPYAGLMKVDIEGSEYEMFERATPNVLQKIKMIVGEYHKGDLGNLINKVKETHNVRTFGKKDLGQFEARRYN